MYVAMHGNTKIDLEVTEFTEVTDKKADKLSLGDCSICTYSTTCSVPRLVRVSHLPPPSSLLLCM